MGFVPAMALAGTVVAVALSNGGCSAVSTLAQAAQGCDEFPSMVDTLSLNSDAQAFVQAGADLVTIAGTLEDSVLASCIGIDADLMVTDTWTAMGPASGGTKDAELTEACKQASLAINTGLGAGGSAQASCGLSISGGQCTVSADVEASCEGSCSAMANCTPPDITVACQPGDLSVQCGGSCNVNATCEGSVSAVATCTGSCEADCTGSCSPGTAPSVHCQGTCNGMCTGSCVASGGTNMVTNAACAGTCSGSCTGTCKIDPGTPAHCDGTCMGTCNGNCKLDANASVMCGASVNCKGGCSVMGTAPKCEGQITPAMCDVSANCKAACQSHADIQASCTPPTVTLECEASASSGAQAVVMTVQKNFPAIIAAVQTQGPLALAAIKTLGSSGSAVVSEVGTVGGKALACATAAASASVNATASIQVTVTASASVSGSAGGPNMPAAAM
jgi:hypothetical protein